MIRLAFLEILLFATPFILFALWRLSMKATEEVVDHKPAPTIVLSAIGGLLAALGFVLLVFTARTGDTGHTTYVPPRFTNGEIGGAEFNDNPGETPSHETRVFARPDASDDDGTDDEDGDDGGSPQPR